MLISHEVPKCLFRDSLEFNDYDYALVHLFDKDPEYLAFYKESVKKGRHVLLDNSIFELGEAYDNEQFAKWVDELRPTEYIVPDALEDADKTIKQISGVYVFVSSVSVFVYSNFILCLYQFVYHLFVILLLAVNFRKRFQKGVPSLDT